MSFVILVPFHTFCYKDIIYIFELESNYDTHGISYFPASFLRS
jgi:hypothetical protein